MAGPPRSSDRLLLDTRHALGFSYVREAERAFADRGQRDEVVMGDAVGVKSAGDKGRGVFARREFRAGDLVLRFEVGRIVHTNEVPTLSAGERNHLSELTAESCQILPPPRCYVNHACAPNAISTSSDLRALRDIGIGDEITIDYRLNALDDWEMACACGATGGPHTVIGNFFTLPDDLQQRYLPDAPAFVQEEYRRRHGEPGHR